MHRPAYCLLLAVALSACGVPKSADERVYPMGDRAQAGPLIYTVTGSQWRDDLAAGARKPSQRFLVLRFAVTNSGAVPLPIPTMELVDGSGRTYGELTDGAGLAEWMGAIRTVDPAQTEHGSVLFDVPSGDYKVRVRHQAEPGERAGALIEIPYRPGV